MHEHRGKEHAFVPLQPSLVLTGMTFESWLSAGHWHPSEGWRSQSQCLQEEGGHKHAEVWHALTSNLLRHLSCMTLLSTAWLLWLIRRPWCAAPQRSRASCSTSLSAWGWMMLWNTLETTS